MKSATFFQKPSVYKIGLFLLILLVIFCVWPGMHAPPFADDIHQKMKSKSFDSWTEIFGTDAFAYFRPVKNAIFMLAASLEKNMFQWHLIGLISFLAAVIGVFQIAWICFESRITALLAASLWALSPSCVSTAVWLSCANISIGIAFISLVFHFHEKWMTRNSPAALVGCGLCYAIALLSYESLIIFPALFFIRDFQQRRISFNRKAVITYATYTVVAIAFLVIRSYYSAKPIGGSAAHVGFDTTTKPIHLFLSAPWFLWRHFLMWAYPFGTLEVLGNYSWLRSAPESSLVLAWFFLAGLIASAFATWKRYPIASYGIIFFLVASFPSGNFIPCFNGPIYDAYVTIPSIGLALSFASACAYLLRTRAKLLREAKSGAAILVVLLGIFLTYRLPICGAYFRYWAGVWSHPSELLLLTVDTRPYLYQPKAFASIFLIKDGYIDAAETLAREVLVEDPTNAVAKLALANIADGKNDSKTAEQLYRNVLDTPNAPPFAISAATEQLAVILAASPASSGEAIELFKKLLKAKMNTHNVEAILMLSKLYAESGNYEKAKATLAGGLTYNPLENRLETMLKALMELHPSPVGIPTEGTPKIHD